MVNCCGALGTLRAFSAGASTLGSVYVIFTLSGFDIVFVLFAFNLSSSPVHMFDVDTTIRTLTQ